MNFEILLDKGFVHSKLNFCDYILHDFIMSKVNRGLHLYMQNLYFFWESSVILYTLVSSKNNINSYIFMCLNKWFVIVSTLLIWLLAYCISKMLNKNNSDWFLYFPFSLYYCSKAHKPSPPCVEILWKQVFSGYLSETSNYFWLGFFVFPWSRSGAETISTVKPGDTR